jgi:hypothetical protein
MHQKQMVQMHPVYFFYWEGDLDDLCNRDYNNIITCTVSVMLVDCYSLSGIPAAAKSPNVSTH